MIEYRKLTHEDYNDITDMYKDIWGGTDYLPELFHKWVDDTGFFLDAKDFAVESWKPSYEEFANLPFAFYFQKPTPKLYEELLKEISDSRGLGTDCFS